MSGSARIDDGVAVTFCWDCQGPCRAWEERSGWSACARRIGEIEESETLRVIVVAGVDVVAVAR